MNTNYDELYMLLENTEALEGVGILLTMIPLFLILGLLIERIILGLLCRKLADKKGYKGYFFTGFFLGTLGFVYVIFLPDQKLRKYVRGCAVRLQMMDSRIEQLEDGQQSQMRR